MSNSRSNGLPPTDDGQRSVGDGQRSRLPAIVNSDAGTAALVLDALEKAGGFDVRECAGAEVGAAVRALVDAGHRRIVVAGGDGTVSAAAAEVVGTETELAIIPGGTLNHFASDHGIPGDVEHALAVVRSGTAHPTDIARVEGRIFLNTSSAGAYVSLVQVRDRLEPRFGYTLASLAAAIRVFFTIDRFVVQITGPDGPRTFRTPLLFIGVGERELKLPTLGGRVSGGRAGLHVMVVRGRTRGAILALALAAAIRGIRGVRTPHLETAVLGRCTVTLNTRTLVSVDGELVTLHSPLEYELLRGALRLVRP